MRETDNDGQSADDAKEPQEDPTAAENHTTPFSQLDPASRKAAVAAVASGTIDEWVSPRTPRRLVGTKVEQLYRELYDEINRRQQWHQKKATVLSGINVLLGLPIAVLSAVSGTAALATLGAQAGNIWRYVVATISLIIVLLSTVQTYFKFPDQVKKHEDAAAAYWALLWDMKRAIPATEDEFTYDAFDSFLRTTATNRLQEIDMKFRGIEQPTSQRWTV